MSLGFHPTSCTFEQGRSINVAAANEAGKKVRGGVEGGLGWGARAEALNFRGVEALLFRERKEEKRETNFLKGGVPPPFWRKIEMFLLFSRFFCAAALWALLRRKGE